MIPTEPYIALFRHASTAFNSEGDDEKLRGWLDKPLTAEGKEEAKRLAQYLSQWPIQLINTTDRQCGKQVAYMIQEANKSRPPVLVTMALRSWATGSLSGQKYKDVKQQVMDLMLKTPDKPAPGQDEEGNQGESYNTFLKRILTFWEVQKKKVASDEMHILNIGHSRGARAIDAHETAGGSNAPLLAIDVGVLKQKRHIEPTEGLLYLYNNEQFVKSIVRVPQSAKPKRLVEPAISL